MSVRAFAGVTAGLLVVALAAAPTTAEPVAGSAAAEGVETTTSEVVLVPVATDAPQGEADVPDSGPGSGEGEGPAAAARVELNSDIAVFGVTWSDDAPQPVNVEFRTLSGGSWTEWTPLELETTPEGVEAAGPTATEPVSVTDVEAVEVVAAAEPGVTLPELLLHVIDPRGAQPVENRLTEAPYAGVAATTSSSALVAGTVYETGASYGLSINTRAAWGADESLPQREDSESVRYRGAVVHHTAHGGPNNYTQAQVPGLIRSFDHYHTVVLGWGDIGYQLLVDRFGGVWEGRRGSLDRQLLGAQAYGGNFETFGVAVIGTWSGEPPPPAAMDAAARAITWMFERYGLGGAYGDIWIPGGDGRGRIVPKIVGHRDVSSGSSYATACPGQAFYDRLPALRDLVNGHMNPALSGAVSRHSGVDRFDTSASAALASFAAPVSTVYIASGSGFPDALAGGPAAGVDGAPILLTLPDRIPQRTVEALGRLAPERIVILGGRNSVGSAVEAQLGGFAGEVSRMEGSTRYDTAAEIARRSLGDASTVYVANGELFPDALSAGPVAGIHGSPILLTTAGGLHPAAEAALGEIRPQTIVLLGGESAVGGAVERRLRTLAPEVQRVAGGDRFGTGALVTGTRFAGQIDTVYVASGGDFPDALSAGPSAVGDAAPLLLVRQDRVPAATAAALAQLQPRRIVVMGGESAVSKNVVRVLDQHVRR